MKIKELKDFLENFEDDRDFVILGKSGQKWEFDKESIAKQTVLGKALEKVTVRIK